MPQHSEQKTIPAVPSAIAQVVGAANQRNHRFITFTSLTTEDFLSISSISGYQVIVEEPVPVPQVSLNLELAVSSNQVRKEPILNSKN